ncbi:MAG: hypothetical protein AAF492_13785, partial [Verrucomicrobiota bacterium]
MSIIAWTFSGLQATAQPLGWSFTNWTGDADSGISNLYTYTATHCFGDNHAGVTVNGVLFPGSFANAGPNWSIGGGQANWNGDDNANLTGTSEDLGEEFVYAGNPRTIQFYGLAPGAKYKATFFSVGWEAAGRVQTFQSGPDNLVLDQDNYGNNNGIAISHVYIATNTSQEFIITPGGAGTFHLYAMANREASELSIDNLPPIDVGTTNAGLVGRLSSTGEVSVSVYVSTNNNPDAASWLADPIATNIVLGTWSNVSAQTLTGTVSMLFSNLTYYFTFVASNSATNIWASPNGLFTTVGQPMVDNNGGAQNLLSTTADLHGRLTDGGAAEGFILWGDNDPGTMNTSDWDNVVAMGDVLEGVGFSIGLTGLTPVTPYYYRCYVTNSAGLAWSPTLNLVTLDVNNLMMNNAGGNDSWNVGANWTLGHAPFGMETAGVAPGVIAIVQNSGTPVYSGSLTLQSNAILRILNANGSQNAFVGATNIVMETGSRIQMNINANPTFPPIMLAGDAIIESLFGASDWQTDTFGPISGPGRLTLSGFNGHQYHLNASNSFSELIANAIDRYVIQANAPGSLGLGDVTINPRPGGEGRRSAVLMINAPDAMADTATLTLNGSGWDSSNGGPFAGSSTRVVMNANDTIQSLYINGMRLPSG